MTAHGTARANHQIRRVVVALLVAVLLATVAPVAADGPLAPLGPGTTQQRLSREVFGYLPYWELDDGVDAYLRYDLLTTIAFFGVTFKADGTLDTSLPGYKAYQGELATNVITKAHAAGVRTVVTFQGFSLARNAALLSNPAARATFVQQAVALMAARGADGASIDIENLDNEYFDEFGLLSGELKAAATAVNPDAQISVATNASVSGARMAAAALANGVDRAFLMGYNYRSATSSPVGSIDPLVRAGGGLSLTASLDLYAQYGAPLDRVILGVAYYGRTWPTVGPEVRSPRQTDTAAYGVSTVFYPRTLPASAVGATQDYDTVEQAARLLWWDAGRGTWMQSYYNDETSLAAKVALTLKRGLAGIGMWALGFDRGQVQYWNAIAGAYAALTVTAVGIAPLVPPPTGGVQPGFTNMLGVLVNPIWQSDAAPASEVSLSSDGIGWSGWQPLVGAIPWQLPPGPDGPRSVFVRVRTAIGGESPPFQATVMLDTTVPTIGVPAVAPARGSVAGKNDVPVRIVWAGTDAGPIASSSLEVSTDGAPYLAGPTPYSASPNSSFVLPLKLGVAYTFRVGAIDAAGNVAIPTESAVVTFVKTENSANGVRYSAAWRKVASTSASGGSLTSATARGATVTYRFTGTGIAILGPVGPTRGVARVSFDGVAAGSLNAYAEVGGSRRALYSRLLAPGAHTVVITLAGPSTHPRVDLDALIVTK